MAERTYTLKQVCALVGLSEEPAQVAKLARQIRHWTSCDLLHPTSGKHTGTGVSRRYTIDAVRRAAILVEIGRYRVPVPVISEFADAMDNYMDMPEWRLAIEGDRPVFLQLAWNEYMTSWMLTADVPEALHLGAKGLKGSQTTSDEAFHVTSAIVMNLSTIFSRIPF